MKLTRREMAILLASTPAAAQATASPEEELRAAIEQNRKNSEALAKIQLPLPAEPAFVFRP